ncbi:MAG TPA: B12-binding domain-containing radical SAM protein, partial [bacterium]|nr:B12-binding domain-containing radical SAM protein [bacterium]
MELILINPPQPYLVEKHTQTPLGILYISAVVKRDRPDVDVSVCDLSDCSEPIEVPDADVYGYTSTSLDYPECVKLMETIRMEHPGSLHIIGGSHATAMPFSCRDDGFDSVFIRESEKTILEYIDDWMRVDTVEFYEADNLVDVCTLPWPDRDALGWTGGRILASGNDRSASLMASRGCPFNCAFCASALIWKRKMRWRSPENVVAEMKHCIEKYNVTTFRFADDSMTSNRDWVQEFCKAVEPLGVRWQTNERVDTVTIDLLKMMRDAGCVEIGYGVESFDPMVLKILGKKISPEQSIRAVEMTFKTNIGVWLLMMISTPGETYKHTVQCNSRALARLVGKFVRASCKTLMPLPGTPIWNDPERFGVEILNRDFSTYNAYPYKPGPNGRPKLILCRNDVSTGSFIRSHFTERNQVYP